MYYHDYDNLRAGGIGTFEIKNDNGRLYMDVFSPLVNQMKGEAYGLEIAAGIQPAKWWNWKTSYTISDLRLDLKRDLSVGGLEEIEENQTETKVEGDRLELRRVFTNLIGNAIKFTDEGSVKVFLKQVTETEPPTLLITVEDTGPGVSPEDQKSLFERFRKGKHRNSGSGLGLHLSQRILESHNGSISLESEVGKGSRFTVKLPVKVE